MDISSIAPYCIMTQVCVFRVCEFYRVWPINKRLTY